MFNSWGVFNLLERLNMKFPKATGVLCINMIKNNLVLLGVNSSWQRAAVGVLLVIGITIQAISENRKNKRQKSSSDSEVV